MIKKFFGPMVFGQVCNIPIKQNYFFVGINKGNDLFCHKKRGVSTLEVTVRGDIVTRKCGDVSIPTLNDRIVIIRESNDPENNKFTKALMWVQDEIWDKVSWAINCHKRYRAIGYDYYIDGHRKKQENELIEDQLIEIVRVEPWKNCGYDKLGEMYCYETGKKKCSYKTRWECLGPDGSWTICLDPRARYPVTF